MGERMPACHYIAPDFDPKMPARRCKPKNGQHQVRFMLPMAIQCTNCGEYIHAGTKANCRKELCYTEFYLGTIHVWRIYLHCKACYSEITVKTDPKNLDYIIEKGATRHFEPWRNFLMQKAMEEKARLKGSIIQQAEEKTVDMKRDMEHTNELERLRAESTKLNSVNLTEIPLTEEENQQILTELDRQKIELFEMKKQEEMKLIQQQTVLKGSVFASSDSGDKVVFGPTKKKSLFSKPLDEDEF